MENIFTSSKSFLTYAKFLGFLPVTFIGPAREGLFKISWPGLFASCCTLLILIFGVKLNARSEETYKSVSTFMDTACKIVINTELSSFTFLLFYQIHLRKKVENFLRLLDKYDQDVSGKNFLHKF